MTLTTQYGGYVEQGESKEVGSVTTFETERLVAHGEHQRNRTAGSTWEVSEKSYGVEYSRIIKKMVVKSMVVCGRSTYQFTSVIGQCDTT